MDLPLDSKNSQLITTAGDLLAWVVGKGSMTFKGMSNELLDRRCDDHYHLTSFAEN